MEIENIISGQLPWNIPSGAYARRIIAELEAKGYVIVPRDPTPEMVEAFDESGYGDPPYMDAYTSWQAMVSAAQKSD